MPEPDRTEAAQRLTESFGESYRNVLEYAIDAQQRNVSLAQGWAENLSGVMRNQAETNQALTRAMGSYVKVVEEAVESQERTSRALAESLESYKEVIDRVVVLQEKNVETSRGFFEGVIGELKAQSDGNLRMAEDMMEGSERQLDAFQAMFQEAVSTYSEMMNAPYEMHRKNMEAFGARNK
jgi:flagellar hook-basal body complex protein FliE